MEYGRSTILRYVALAAALCLAVAPALPLVISTWAAPTSGAVWTRAFADSLISSLLLGVGVAVLSLAIGLPLGVLAALYRFPGRATLTLFQALPLLLPSFLPCIGWSNLAATPGLRWLPMPNGFSGCIFVMGLQAVPLVFFATWTACRNLTASQIESARLHGGEASVLEQSGRACLPVGIVVALLAGILTLSDPGAPLIFGARSVAVEIRTSFSALFDYELAGRQCLLLAGIVLLLTAPVLAAGIRRLAAAMLARQTRSATPYAHPVLGRAAMSGLLVVLLLSAGVPALGLCLPALANPMIGRAADKVVATAGTTAVFTIGAGAIAAGLALVFGLATGRRSGLRLLVVALLLLLLALPPALAAIGVVRVSTQAPPQLDWLTRSRFTVALVLGLRFLPVAAVAVMRAVGSLAPSWSDAARVHGVAPVCLLSRVVLPLLAPTLLVVLVLVAVLAAADITTTHLLQPPGSQSLPVAIFTVMANSPEGLVASLCLLYLLSVALLLGVASQLPRLWRRNAA